VVVMRRARLVGPGRRLGPVVPVLVRRRFRLGGGRQAVVQRRCVVPGAGAAAVAVGQQRVFAAPGDFVLDEPAYVRQQEHSLTLSARQQVHLIGPAGALCRVRIRCKHKARD